MNRKYAIRSLAFGLRRLWRLCLQIARMVGRKNFRALAAIVTLSASAHADFDNTDARNNADDLRAMRRAMAGWDDGGPQVETPIPPTALDAGSSVHGELRAQTILQHQIACILLMLLGVGLAQITFAQVKTNL